MIISVRGNHASGKSTVVYGVLAKLKSVRPVFGVLGPRLPEAYACEFNSRPVYVLGPYIGTSHAGADYLTKKGIDTLVKLGEKYVGLGSIVLESAQTATRFLEPSFGKFLLEHKENVIAAVLDTSMEEVLKALHKRQEASEFKGGEKHIFLQQRQVELSTAKFVAHGFRVEWINRDNGASKILSWL